MEELNDKLHYAIWLIKNEVMKKMQANLLKWMRACITMSGVISNIYCEKSRCSKI